MKTKTFTRKGASFTYRIFFTILCLLGLFPAEPAAANIFDDLSQEVSRAFDYLMPDAWQDENVRLALGGGALQVPDYEGSNDYKTQLFPMIDFRLGDAILFQTNQVKLVATDWPLRMGAIARLDLGRSQDANPAVAEINKVGTAIEVGGFAEGIVDNWVMQIELRQDILSGHKGLIAKATLGRLFELGERWRVIAAGRMNWANNRYTDSFFEITPAEAAASGYRPFNPGGGFKDIGAGVIGSYAASDRVTVQAGFGYQRLLGGASNSPIVTGPGSADQMTAGIAVRYTVWRTQE